MAIKPSDIELLKVGDKLYRTMRFGVGNTTIRETSIFHARALKTIITPAGHKTFKINWNSNVETFSAGCLEDHWFLFHPTPKRSCRDWFPRDQAAADKRWEEEQAEWRARRKAAKVTP
jgi:hypothetical protein